MIEEIRLLDVVALIEDVPEEGLRHGEVGTVVEAFADAPDIQGALLVEFSEPIRAAYAFADLRPESVKLRYRDAHKERQAA